MLELIHYIHIVSGSIWGGAAVVGTLVWNPALRALPPEMIKTYYRAVGLRGRRVIGLAAMVAMLSGLVRGYVGGGVTSFADLLAPYGLYMIAALLVFLGIRFYGIRNGKAVMAALAAGEDPRPAMASTYRMDVLVYPGGVFVLLGIMVIMRMGLY
ncbi:hypothetical protein [Pelagibacterium limicola]|uniref:hypothetical protein n=1 Tax=Pelagibacterium limicola TaxID=2791022 RepID=UPI0018B0084F|nr:hypothetical protein [Pelagibacterium limicola]